MKEYLCKCGATDPVEFYGTNKSTCKKCRSAHNKQLRIEQNKTKQKLCTHCGEDDPTLFPPKRWVICYECTRKYLRATHDGKIIPYLCEDCGEDDPKMFSRKKTKRCCKACASKRELKKYHALSYDEKKALQQKQITSINKRFYKHLLGSIKTRAIAKDFPNELSVEYLKQLYIDQGGLCYLSGLSMVVEVKSPHSVSVDRIDSSLGYTKDNVALCCASINRMKSNMTNEDFRRFCEAVTTWANRD